MTDRCILWIRDGYLPRLLKKTDGAFHLIAQPVKSLSHRPVEVFTHSYVTPTVTQNPELVTNSRLHFDFIASAHGATWLIMTNCAVFWRFAGVPCSDVLKIQIKTAHIWGVTLVKRLDYCVRWASLTGCSRFHDETGPCDVLAFIWKYIGLLHHTFLILGKTFSFVKVWMDFKVVSENIQLGQIHQPSDLFTVTHGLWE